MSENNRGNFMPSKSIRAVIDKIAERMQPARIYLYNQRINSKNMTTSFKLCVVADVQDKFAAERDIYMSTDCDVSFDILIYTTQEWEELTEDPNTFARKILDTGTEVYHG